MRSLTIMASVMIGVWVGSLVASAESRPLKQLPADIVRWSTVWVNIPEQMYVVGQEEGPLAAMTWGPAKGAVVMVQSTTQELWEAMKPDERPGHRSQHGDVHGALLRYEF